MGWVTVGRFVHIHDPLNSVNNQVSKSNPHTDHFTAFQSELSGQVTYFPRPMYSI